MIAIDTNEKKLAYKHLNNVLKDGTNVYSIQRKRSKQGAIKLISLVIVDEEKILDISMAVAMFAGYEFDAKESAIVKRNGVKWSMNNCSGEELVKDLSGKINKKLKHFWL